MLQPAREFNDAGALGLGVVDAAEHCQNPTHGGGGGGEANGSGGERNGEGKWQCVKLVTAESEESGAFIICWRFDRGRRF